MIRKFLLWSEVFLLLCFLRYLLSFKGIKDVLYFIERFEFGWVCNNVLQNNAAAINTLSSFIPKCTCLVRAGAFKLLAPNKINLKLVIGIHNSQKFQSHAWIESDKVIIYGKTENQEKYSTLMEIL